MSGEELLRFPVRLDGMDVGRAVDVILDPDQGRVLGVDVLCRDEVHRFLPLAAAELREGEIRLSSAFALLDEAGFDFYRGRASSLRTLKGIPVARRGRKLGELRDVVLSADGDIEAFVVRNGDEGSRSIAVGPGVSLDGNARNGSG